MSEWLPDSTRELIERLDARLREAEQVRGRGERTLAQGCRRLGTVADGRSR